MVEVNLKDYCSILQTKTNSGEYVWEQAGDNKYRLVMLKGSIVLERSYSAASGYYYEISFYGTTALIYTGNISSRSPLFNQYVQLYNTIVSKNNEKINNEITNLFM